MHPPAFSPAGPRTAALAAVYYSAPTSPPEPISQSQSMSLSTLYQRLVSSHSLTREHSQHIMDLIPRWAPAPRDIQLNIQRLYTPTAAAQAWRMFHQRFVLKIHLDGESIGYITNRQYHFHRGEGILIFPFEPHFITSARNDAGNDGQLRLIANFSLSHDDQRRLEPLRGRLVVLDDGDWELVEQMFTSANSSDTVKQCSSIFALNTLLLRFLGRAETQLPGSPSQTQSKIGLLMDELNSSCFTGASIKELAAKTGCSETGFRRLFIREAGQSPGRVLQQLRLRKAVDELLHSAKPVGVIGGECGFSDPYVFSRAFKRFFGLSPRQFRACGGTLQQAAADRNRS